MSSIIFSSTSQNPILIPTPHEKEKSALNPIPIALETIAGLTPLTNANIPLEESDPYSVLKSKLENMTKIFNQPNNWVSPNDNFIAVAVTNIINLSRDLENYIIANPSLKIEPTEHLIKAISILNLLAYSLNTLETNIENVQNEDGKEAIIINENLIIPIQDLIEKLPIYLKAHENISRDSLLNLSINVSKQIFSESILLLKRQKNPVSDILKNSNLGDQERLFYKSLENLDPAKHLNLYYHSFNDTDNDTELLDISAIIRSYLFEINHPNPFYKSTCLYLIIWMGFERFNEILKSQFFYEENKVDFEFYSKNNLLIKNIFEIQLLVSEFGNTVKKTVRTFEKKIDLFQIYRFLNEISKNENILFSYKQISTNTEVSNNDYLKFFNDSMNHIENFLTTIPADCSINLSEESNFFLQNEIPNFSRTVESNSLNIESFFDFYKKFEELFTNTTCWENFFDSYRKSPSEYSYFCENLNNLPKVLNQVDKFISFKKLINDYLTPRKFGYQECHLKKGYENHIIFDRFNYIGSFPFINISSSPSISYLKILFNFCGKIDLSFNFLTNILVNILKESEFNEFNFDQERLNTLLEELNIYVKPIIKLSKKIIIEKGSSQLDNQSKNKNKFTSNISDGHYFKCYCLIQDLKKNITSFSKKSKSIEEQTSALLKIEWNITKLIELQKEKLLLELSQANIYQSETIHNFNFFIKNQSFFKKSHKTINFDGLDEEFKELVVEKTRKQQSKESYLAQKMTKEKKIPSSFFSENLKDFSSLGTNLPNLGTIQILTNQISELIHFHDEIMKFFGAINTTFQHKKENFKLEETIEKNCIEEPQKELFPTPFIKELIETNFEDVKDEESVPTPEEESVPTPEEEFKTETINLPVKTPSTNTKISNKKNKVKERKQERKEKYSTQHVGIEENNLIEKPEKNKNSGLKQFTDLRNLIKALTEKGYTPKRRPTGDHLSFEKKGMGQVVVPISYKDRVPRGTAHSIATAAGLIEKD